MMEIALMALLLDSPTITNLLGTRINYTRRLQDHSELPAATLSKVSAVRDLAMSGPTNLIQSRFQCDCFGETYSQAKTAANAIIALLNGFTGTKSGVKIQLVKIDGERDFNETESDADRHLFRTSIDLLIWHDE